MKTIPSGIQTAIDNRSTSLVRCWKITRTDGLIYGFTEHDQPLDINADGLGAVTYYPNDSFNTDAMSYSDEMDVDGEQILGITNTEVFSEEDIIAGRFKSAEVKVFLVDWTNLAAGIVKLRKGILGEFEWMDFGFKVEIQGLSYLLQTNVVSLYSPRCRSKFGDQGSGTSGGCRMDLYALTHQATIATVTNRKQFTLSGLVGTFADGTGGSKTGGYFQHGQVTFLDGPNSGVSREISTYSTAGGGTVGLYLPVPFEPEVGNTISIAPGCDKTLEVCRDNWDNLNNMRAEPYTPGEDVFFRVVQARRSSGSSKK